MDDPPSMNDDEDDEEKDGGLELQSPINYDSRRIPEEAKNIHKLPPKVYIEEVDQTHKRGFYEANRDEESPFN